MTQNIDDVREDLIRRLAKARGFDPAALHQQLVDGIDPDVVADERYCPPMPPSFQRALIETNAIERLCEIELRKLRQLDLSLEDFEQLVAFWESPLFQRFRLQRQRIDRECAERAVRVMEQVRELAMEQVLELDDPFAELDFSATAD